MDRETAVYQSYLRKKNTDLLRKQKTKLRTRKGQRDSSLPFLPQKEYRLRRQSKDKE